MPLEGVGLHMGTFTFAHTAVTDALQSKKFALRRCRLITAPWLFSVLEPIANAAFVFAVGRRLCWITSSHVDCACSKAQVK